MFDLEDYRKKLKVKSTQELFDMIRRCRGYARQAQESVLAHLKIERVCFATLQLYQYLEKDEVQDSIRLNEILKELHCRVERKTYEELFSGKRKEE